MDQDMHVTSKRTEYTPPALRANARSRGTSTPVANYHFESDWRADGNQPRRDDISANKRRRLALPKLRTQFSGRDMRAGIAYIEVPQHDYEEDAGRGRPVRRSLFREEVQSVAGSGYEGDNEDSREK